MNKKRKEIQNNCSCCHEPYEEFDNMGDYYSHFNNSGQIVAEVYSSDKVIIDEPFYCPMCGRDLGD